MLVARILLLAAATSIVLPAQTVVTLDGTSGANAVSTGYSTNGGLTLSLGFFVDYLIVGGGGGGGGSVWGSHNGGGGGGGEFIAGSSLRLNATSYQVVVGAGGAGGRISARIGVPTEATRAPLASLPLGVGAAGPKSFQGFPVARVAAVPILPVLAVPLLQRPATAMQVVPALPMGCLHTVQEEAAVRARRALPALPVPREVMAFSPPSQVQASTTPVEEPVGSITPRLRAGLVGGRPVS